MLIPWTQGQKGLPQLYFLFTIPSLPFQSSYWESPLDGTKGHTKETNTVIPIHCAFRWINCSLCTFCCVVLCCCVMSLLPGNSSRVALSLVTCWYSESSAVVVNKRPAALLEFVLNYKHFLYIIVLNKLNLWFYTAAPDGLLHTGPQYP